MLLLCIPNIVEDRIQSSFLKAQNVFVKILSSLFLQSHHLAIWCSFIFVVAGKIHILPPSAVLDSLYLIYLIYLIPLIHKHL